MVLIVWSLGSNWRIAVRGSYLYAWKLYYWPQSGLLVQLALKILFFSNLSVAAALSNTNMIYIGRNPKYSIPRPPQRYIKGALTSQGGC